MKWEYQVCPLQLADLEGVLQNALGSNRNGPVRSGEAMLSESLNKMGEAGWELVCTVSQGGFGPYGLFKRAKQQ